MKIKTFGPVDERSLKQLETCMKAGDAEFGVLCADHHPGYSQPIGGGIAYEGFVSPTAVGFDIGCGNKAVRTDIKRDVIRVPRVMSEIARRISFGVGVPNAERMDHPVLDSIKRAPFEPQRKLYDLAVKQLGSVGGGNHYVNVFADEDDNVWVGVHFGSRGFGHKTASGFLALAQGLSFEARAREGGMDSPPVLFAVESDVGQSYIEAMNLAGEYAYAGRDLVVDKVLGILGAEATYEVHNHHNFCIAGDQTVPTTAGPKRMDEIVEGDMVYAFTPDGPNPAHVVDAWSSGSQPIYTISVGPRTIRCSGSHPIMVVDGSSIAWRNAADLEVGDIVVCADGYYPRSQRWGTKRARLVGAFLGDGWIRHEPAQRGYALGLAIGTANEAHTHRYAALASTILPNTGWGKGWTIDRPGHFGVSCSSKSAWSAAVEMGLGERSRRKRVPPEAFALCREDKLALLAGYVDADGSVASAATSNHGRGHIASVSLGLVADLRELAIGCGLQVTSIETTRRRTNFGDAEIHRCTIAAASTATLPLWNTAKSANQRVPSRKTKGLTSQYLGGLELPAGFFARRVRKVEIGDPEPVYDLTVDDPSHTFIVEGIVTHNCWKEEHFGRTYWVVRKGCTPARSGQEGFVGASMGEPSVILEGLESADSEESLYSTVHGAGRVMSRTQAAGKRRKGKVIRPGLVDWHAVRRRLKDQRIVLVGGGADEAPEVYKRLPDVLAAHGDSIRVKHTLRPLGVAMAGADVFDPYKD